MYEWFQIENKILMWNSGIWRNKSQLQNVHPVKHIARLMLLFFMVDPYQRSIQRRSSSLNIGPLCTSDGLVL